MRKCIFRQIVFIALSLVPVCLTADNKYDKRVHRYRSAWEKLIPTHTKIQFAGDMGFLSFGTGWDYGKRDQWETDIFFGFIPKYSTDKAKATFTLKETYLPWSFRIKNRIAVEPLSCGLYFNTLLNGDFWVNQPDKYPHKYYEIPSKIRTHIFMGQRITFNISEEHRVTAKALSVFYEISTCDLYIISRVGNPSMRPRDFLRLSFGIKLQLM